MPRDVPLHDGAGWSTPDRYDAGAGLPERLERGQAGSVWSRSADVREASLKREIARLTRERNRLLRGQTVDAQGTPPVAAPNEARRAQDAVRLAAKDDLVRALYASHSWRVTAPFRAMAQLFGRAPEPAVEVALALTNAVSSAAARSLSPDESVETSPVRRRPNDRSRGEVVFVAPHLPLFDRQAGGLRLKTLIGMVAGQGWTVTFCATSPMDWGPAFLSTAKGRAVYEGALRQVGVTRFVYGIDGIRTSLIEAGGRMRYAFVSFPEVASDVMPIIRTHCPWARVIFDTVDLHFLRMQREAELREDPLLRRKAERMRQVELACVRSADVTVAVSDEERRLLLDLVPDVVVETLPCVFKVPASAPPGPAARSGLLFVGGFWHPPNGDAALWFVEHVWPLIHAEAPDVVFRIAGADPTPEVQALGRLPGIEVIGHRPDLAPLFDAARAFVAPIRFGAGMKGKVGQSLIHGLPVVSTSIGAEGMSLVAGEHLLVADAPEDFAEHVLCLLRDDGLWSCLQTNGRALIEATLSETAVARRVETLFRA